MSDLAGIEEIGHAAAALKIYGPSSAPHIIEETEILSVGFVDRVPDGHPGGTMTVTKETLGPEIVSSFLDEQTAKDDVEPQLFDSSVYVEAVSFDGQAADEIVVAFSGQIKYPAADLEGRKLFDGLQLGKAVELRVAGFVAAKTGSYKVTARKKEKVTGKAQVKVDTVYLLSPEELAG